MVYKNWSFAFVIYMIVFRWVIFIWFENGQVNEHYRTILFVLISLNSIFTITAPAFLIMSTLKREKKDFKFWFSLAGISTILGLILSNLFS